MASPKKVTTSKKAINRQRYLPFHLVNLANTLSRSASRLYLTLFGVGVIEWRILSILAIESNVTAVHICQSIDLDGAAASRSLRSLEKMGLVNVAKDAKDSRKRLITLTNKGRTLHDQILQVATRRHDTLTEGFSEEQLDQLFDIIKTLEKNASEIQRQDAELVKATLAKKA